MKEKESFPSRLTIQRLTAVVRIRPGLLNINVMRKSIKLFVIFLSVAGLELI